MTNGERRIRGRFVVVVLCLVGLVTFGSSSSVFAHTDFVASVPDDGVTVDGPLSTVTIEFTNPAIEFGDGFQLLEPDGTVRIPDDVDPTDGRSFIASFDPALEAGTYGFRWEVQAGDAHPLQGAFQFTVEASATSTTQPSVATAVTDTSTPAAAPASSSNTEGDTDAVTLDEFLAVDETSDPWVGRTSRTVSIGATVFAGGVVAALTWVVRGRRDEIERLLVWVRLAGLGLIAGGFISFASLEESQPSDGVFDIGATKPGVAALLTIAGGVLVVAGFRAGAGQIVRTPRALSAAVAVDELAASRPEETPSTGSAEQLFRWKPDASAIIGLAGLALVLGSYWFDGHTVSRGPWIAHAAINLVHVASASIWVGGVFAMTLVAMMRSRRHTDTGVAAMVVRFSTIATYSLIALAVAGAAMAWLVLESPADLFTTQWGRVLLVKVGFVAIAAGFGGYNHFVLRPALEAHPDDPGTQAHLRRSLAIESVAMIAVVVATAVLVAANTS